MILRPLAAGDGAELLRILRTPGGRVLVGQAR